MRLSVFLDPIPLLMEQDGIFILSVPSFIVTLANFIFSLTPLWSLGKNVVSKVISRKEHEKEN